MGRKQEEQGGYPNLTVRIPTFFRCPISLDVMKSPVSLCTGVTYDRSSIQRWLDSGNNTCPATMQPLPSTDLVPNLTLQRLINLWGGGQEQEAAAAAAISCRALIRELRSSSNPAPSLRKLAAFFDDGDADEFEKNHVMSSGDCADVIGSLITGVFVNLEVLEEVVGTVTLIWFSDWIEEGNKKILIKSIGRDLQSSISSLILVLKQGRSVESRTNAAVIIDALLSNFAESKVGILEKNKDLIPELIRLLEATKSNKRAIESGLSCLIALSTIKRERIKMVRSGIVAVLSRILKEDAAGIAVSEKAMKLMEAASGCADGREAICEAAEVTIPAVMERMMKVGSEGREAAVVVVWSVCHLFRDRRAVAAAAASGGGLTKILLLMQSDCSPAVREMAGDLLRVFRVNSKGCLVGYDTKTTHIMPF